MTRFVFEFRSKWLCETTFRVKISKIYFYFSNFYASRFFASLRSTIFCVFKRTINLSLSPQGLIIFYLIIYVIFFESCFLIERCFAQACEFLVALETQHTRLYVHQKYWLGTFSSFLPKSNPSTSYMLAPISKCAKRVIRRCVKK